MVEADWPVVREIYAAGIATGDATFEAEPPDWQEFDAVKLADLRFVAELQGKVVGWVAASRRLAIGCIFPENAASLVLHQRCGFRVVGIRERLGQHGGRWRDVVMIERRSPHL